MLRPHHYPVQVMKMQSFRNLLHHKKMLLLSRSEFLFGSHSLSSNVAQRSKLSYHSSSFGPGDRGSEKGSAGWSETSSASASAAPWASYRPFTDQLESRGEEEPIGWQENRRSWRGSDSGGDLGDGEEKHKVTTFFDPLEGKIMTIPMVEERDAAGCRQAEESTWIESSDQKKISGRPQRLGECQGKGFQKNEVSLGTPYIAKSKMRKVKISYVCENCGGTFGQWWGSCPTCQTAASLKSFSEAPVSRARGAEVSEAAVRSKSWLSQESETMVPLSLADVNMGRKQSEWRIPFVLVRGQISSILAQGFNFEGPAPVVYVSGEEDILDKVQKPRPRALIVDSIQTVYLRGVTGSAGNIMQSN
ncbi:DNA repair protein [Musa troglodytarum]|uniref:DNA repair protein n=1 Tax=Musa troglodytarum TaxID=320322 RepID=A0A9E7KF24_9LILI|nr:DNA repair protein [Musa troglodytarum]